MPRLTGGPSTVETGVEGFADALTSMAGEVVEEDRARLAEAIERAGRVTLAEVRARSPRDTGRYARGWALDLRSDGYGGTEAVVYNRAAPGLAHLLEKGHEEFDFHGRDTGRRTPARPHIEPAYEAGRAEIR